MALILFSFYLCVCAYEIFPPGGEAHQFFQSNNAGSLESASIRPRRGGDLIPRLADSNYNTHTDEGREDIYALLEFKKGVSNDPLGALAGWNSSDDHPCNWNGVSCGRRTSRVQKLHLSGSNLTGIVIAQLGQLAYLVYLNLSANSFRGPIPSELSRLRYLTVLDLSHNHLEQQIPPELGQCTALRVMNLSGNDFQGSIPPSLGNLTGLTSLQINVLDSLSGEIPVELGRLENLEELSLSGNSNLSGRVPFGLGQLKKLLHLNLSSNRLTGTIPRELGQLNELLRLDLSGNLLSGAIPSALGQLTMLRQLYLSENSFFGGVPPELGRMKNLEVLELYSCNLTGNMPPEMGYLANLHSFLVYDNNLGGRIPPELGRLRNLKDLYMGWNGFSGELPPQLGMLQNLQSLDLDRNNMTGHIPSFVANLSHLTYLGLSNNRFSGAVPAFLANCSLLEYIRLEENSLTGGIPWELSSLKNLWSLSVSGNSLTGNVLGIFANSSSLVILDLGRNQFSGALPERWGHVNRSLRVLALGYNRFEGSLPVWLWALPRLQVLDLSNNNFTGQIPTGIAGLQALRKSIEMQHAEPGGRLLGCTQETGPWCSWSVTPALDLSGNQLEGRIPPELGLLRLLIVLNLSSNKLTGPIPGTLADLTELESLDLSRNFLDGQIPPDMTRLSFLADLNLSYNNFSGRVPTGGLFFTFPPSAYLGNVNLDLGEGHPKRDQPQGNPTLSEIGAKGLSKKARIAIITGPVVGLPFLCIAIWYFCRYRTIPAGSSQDCNMYCFVKELKLNAWDLYDAAYSCNNAAIIGRGALSTVYRGVLSSGQVIAVKKLQMADGQNREAVRSFIRECEILSKIRHRNLVKILGAFSDYNTKALLLQFMPNGSLQSHLHDGATCDLTWQTRSKIATGIARAIAYLHTDTGFGQIIHCDLKPSNILLDNEMEAHVSDFGVARMKCTGDPQVGGGDSLSNTFRGSIGYIAPEFAYGHRISEKADVYSFGVVLLEMITRRSPTSGPFPGGFNSLAEWVTSNLIFIRDKLAAEVIDPSLMERAEDDDPDGDGNDYYYLEQIISTLKVGVACCRHDPRQRPPMNSVLNALNNICNKPPSSRPSIETLLHLRDPYHQYYFQP